MADLEDLQARIDQLEGEVQMLGEALALLCFGVNRSPNRTPPPQPDEHAAREAAHLVKRFVLGRNMPDESAFRERARMGEVRQPQ